MKKKIKTIKKFALKKGAVCESFKQLAFKAVVLLLIAMLNSIGLSAIHGTVAYFNDEEISEGNVFQAGTLDFSLNNTDFNKYIGLDETILLSSVLTNSGSLDFQYTVEAEKISGSEDFCNALLLEAKLNGVKEHDENLIPFSASSAAPGTWKFNIEMPVSADNIPHGAVCEIDFVFKGWQAEAANYEDSGFSDEERINVRLVSKMIVLNEFLPNPDGWAYGFDFGSDSSSMPRGEWVEIYNNSDAAFDVLGWYIKDADSNILEIKAANSDNNGNTGDAGETIVPAKGYLVVYDNSNFSLNNDGDTVKLFDNADTLIDSYAYTTVSDYCDIEPTPGDENAEDTFGSCAGVPPNKSYARIPDGIGDWVDPIPTPGTVNKLDQDDSQQAQEIFAVEAVEVVEQEPDIEIIEQPASVEDEIADEPANEPADESADESADEPTDEPADEPTDEPQPEADESEVQEQEPVLKPADEPADEPIDESADESVDKPADEPQPEVDESEVQEPEPVLEPADEPADEPVDEPTDEPQPEVDEPEVQEPEPAPEPAPEPEPETNQDLNL
ncbi:lamin tail domain-containing protein [Patescibacteria group bacterium]|nr:lamin tail domain-containing protein [Patescibacteria group bacterium]MBU4600643.1 lamin tail domain-containing protein [Patescibacteria group bacterium]MCG2698562.1 lamin tail domain-containing protein [Candidatus Parcubacteria bacterium]